MRHILQVDFKYSGPWGADMAHAMEPMARSIADQPGLVWKIWTVNEAAEEAGGIYLFEDLPSAEGYLSMHTARLNSFGIETVNAKIFAVHDALSRLDRGPV